MSNLDTLSCVFLMVASYSLSCLCRMKLVIDYSRDECIMHIFLIVLMNDWGGSG